MDEYFEYKEKRWVYSIELVFRRHIYDV
jgi:hypothetical protein